MAMELRTDLDGAWWPHTASVARELPELLDELVGRLGEITGISVNWSSLAGAPNFNALQLAKETDPRRALGDQRMMTITGAAASATLLVIPCRTSVALAVMVLRCAADRPVSQSERDTPIFRTADQLVRAARAESVRRAQRDLDAGAAHAGAADPPGAD